MTKNIIIIIKYTCWIIGLILTLSMSCKRTIKLKTTSHQQVRLIRNNPDILFDVTKSLLHGPWFYVEIYLNIYNNSADTVNIFPNIGMESKTNVSHAKFREIYPVNTVCLLPMSKTGLRLSGSFQDDSLLLNYRLINSYSLEVLFKQINIKNVNYESDTIKFRLR